MVGASEMRKMKKFINKNPTPADEIHCILYVIRASSNLSTEVSKSFKEIKKVQNSRKGEGMYLMINEKKVKKRFKFFRLSHYLTMLHIINGKLQIRKTKK